MDGDRRDKLDGRQLQPDEIRRQMASIRRNLDGEVDGIVANAQELLDWKQYVRAFPWASLGVVAAAGYFAVPRRLQIISPDKETLAELAKENRLVVKHAPEAEERPGVLGSVINLTGNMLLRAGLAYMGQQAGKIFGEQAAAPPQEQVPHT